MIKKTTATMECQTTDCQYGQRVIKQRVQMQSVKTVPDLLKSLSQMILNWKRFDERGNERMRVLEVVA